MVCRGRLLFLTTVITMQLIASKRYLMKTSHDTQEQLAHILMPLQEKDGSWWDFPFLRLPPAVWNSTGPNEPTPLHYEALKLKLLSCNYSVVSTQLTIWHMKEWGKTMFALLQFYYERYSGLIGSDTLGSRSFPLIRRWLFPRQ